MQKFYIYTSKYDLLTFLNEAYNPYDYKSCDEI